MRVPLTLEIDNILWIMQLSLFYKHAEFAVESTILYSIAHQEVIFHDLQPTQTDKTETWNHRMHFLFLSDCNHF